MLSRNLNETFCDCLLGLCSYTIFVLSGRTSKAVLESQKHFGVSLAGCLAGFCKLTFIGAAENLASSKPYLIEIFVFWTIGHSKHADCFPG